jgi:phosphoribosyl 1,2-cyclic phosphodiesterase
LLVFRSGVGYTDRHLQVSSSASELLTGKGGRMALRFTVLASGSGGNASLVEADGRGVLIDAGLGPRQLASRLAAVGLSWASVDAVLLTHTHSDHWKDRTLAHLRHRRVPFWCHADHHRELHAFSPSFPGLLTDGLVLPFEAGMPFVPVPGMRCLALPVRHDVSTFGFRLEGDADLFGHATAIGYVTDLGCWDEALVAGLADVDLLAIEFNHDVALEHASGRQPALIARVLGDHGHLSNAQSASLLRSVLGRTGAGRLRHLVQLHLSRDCNRPELARAAARTVLDEFAAVVEVHTAEQDQAGRTLALGDGAVRRRPRRAPGRRTGKATRKQAWLPGLEPE